MPRRFFELWRPRQLEFSQVSVPGKREVHRDRALEINRGPLEYYVENYLYCPRLRKGIPKRIIGNSTQHLHMTGNGSHEPEGEKKESRFMGHWVEHTKGSFFNIGE